LEAGRKRRGCFAYVADIMIPSEERRIKMYPMDFEEFLWAMGEDMLMPYIK
jgi:hypothetical protein